MDRGKKWESISVPTGGATGLMSPIGMMGKHAFTIQGGSSLGRNRLSGLRAGPAAGRLGTKRDVPQGTTRDTRRPAS